MAECAAPMVGAPIVAGSAGAAGKLAVLIDNQVGATFPTHGPPEKSAGLIMLSATAVAETAAKSRMGNAEAPEPRMEEARVTRAEMSEAWTEKATAEPAVPASAKSDGNSDRPSPAPWVIPTPVRWIIRVIPGVILWKMIRIALRLNGRSCR